MEANGFVTRARIMSLLKLKGVEKNKLNGIPKNAVFTGINDSTVKFNFMRYEYEYNYFIGAIRYKDKNFGPWTKWQPFG